MQKILKKRVWRDLKENLFRYLALGLLIILGMYIIVSLVGAAETLMQGLAESNAEYKLEDGQFTVFVPLKEDEVKTIENMGVTLEQQFYLDYKLEDDSVLRVFKNREYIDLIVLDEGRVGKAADEVVIEKRYSEEHDILVGDSVSIGGKDYKVTGIGTTPDYDAPFKSFSDTSVDSKNFGTAFVTEDSYKEMKDAGKSMKAEEYVYSYLLNDKTTDKELKNAIQELEFEPEDVEDPIFRDYWEETGGKRDELLNGVDDLLDGSLEMRDGLEELSEHNGDLNEAAGKMFDEYLKEASKSLKSYGLKKDLTEDNFEQELTRLKNNTDSGILRLSISSALDQLRELKDYKDGMKEYTDGVGEAYDGSIEMYDGMKDLKEGTDEFVDTYLDGDLANLTSFIKASDNVRIGAAAEDQIINKQAGLLFGVILMVLFTYVISVFVVHGIEQESSVVGALYALGVKRKDLMRHYLMLPVVVTFISGLAGLLIGISPVGIPMQMVDNYNYFSTPRVETIVPVYLILYGVVMPPVIAVIVNYFVIRKKLSKTALSLIRNEAKQPRGSKINLGNMSFIRTFQVRQMLREMRTGLTVVFGMFICLLCMMIGLNCYVLCKHVSQDNKADTKYEYMYTYKYPTEEVPEGGEEAYAYSFKKEIFGYNLDVTLLGVHGDNPYFNLDEMVKGQSNVVISSAMAQKYLLKEGDKLIVTDEEEEKDYAFTITGITQYAPAFYIFMDIDSMRELFGQGDDYYNVVFADKELEIESGRLYATTSKSEIYKSSEVFSELMSGMIRMVIVLSTFIFCVVMYLMMKVMIDRSSFSIALVKIFGFRTSEIRKLYLNGNFFIIAVGALICIPASKAVMDAMYPSMMVSNVACGIDLSFDWWLYVVVYVGIILFYLLVNTLLVGRLRKMVPAQILKNRE